MNTSSLKLKFRPSRRPSHLGALYFQLLANRKVQCVSTRFRIYPEEWDSGAGRILVPPTADGRHQTVAGISHLVAWQQYQLTELLATDADIKAAAKKFTDSPDGKGVFDFVERQIFRRRLLGRVRCAETMASTLRSFMRFRGFIDLGFDHFDKSLIEEYEAFLKQKGVTRNTSSFYMRNLRSAYNAAVEQGFAQDQQPFKKVYTGVDKTTKRAVTKDDIKKIMALDLTSSPHLDFARDLFLFSFYTRGMPFVDMAHLRHKDIMGGCLVYRRKKTGQTLTIEWTTEMQAIVNKYKSHTHYLLPIIEKEDGTERLQYQNQLSRLNRNLKTIGEMAGLQHALSSYASPHGWATIARDMNVSISIISQALGHDNEKTTQIYLDSIKSSEIDKANRLILNDLL